MVASHRQQLWGSFAPEHPQPSNLELTGRKFREPIWLKTPLNKKMPMWGMEIWGLGHAVALQM